MHVLINSCITKNLNLKFLYLFIYSLSELRTWLKIITRQPFIFLGDFINALHSTKKYLMLLGGFILSPTRTMECQQFLRDLENKKCLDPITLEPDFFKSISFFSQLFTSLRGRRIKPDISISICGSAPGYFRKIENFSYGYINTYMVYTVAPQRLLNCILTLTSNVQYHAVFLYVKSSLLLQARQCMPLSIWFTVYFCPYFFLV